MNGSPEIVLSFTTQKGQDFPQLLFPVSALWQQVKGARVLERREKRIKNNGLENLAIS